MTTSLNEELQRTATDLGFDLVGIVPAEGDFFAELAEFRPWIEAGRAGEMQYLKTTNEAGQYRRERLRNALPWAQSMIVGAINYNTVPAYSTEQPSFDEARSARGWISRYAWSGRNKDVSAETAGRSEPTTEPTDYHDTVLERLRKLESWLAGACYTRGIADEVQSRSYVDTGPIVERVHAKYAGIGWIGKNTCIINQQLGSWLFLGVIVTSLPFELFQEPSPAIPPADRCGTCTRCIEACPTDALAKPYQMDASRCIAYLTIEKRGSIPEELREGVGRHVFGCDICQDVCPWNRRAPVSSLADFQPRSQLVNPPLRELAALSADEFRKMSRGSPIARAKYPSFRRNIAIAIGNSGDTTLLPLLERWSQDDDPIIAEHARWAAEKLKRPAKNHRSAAEGPS
jgi:epoxyqueuosine reductase